MSSYIDIIDSKLHSVNGMSIVEYEIYSLFDAILLTDTLEDANASLKKLEDIQFVLAKAIFKEKMKITPFLKRIVFVFDRIDDNDMKRHLYEKIKSRSLI